MGYEQDTDDIFQSSTKNLFRDNVILLGIDSNGNHYQKIQHSIQHRTMYESLEIGVSFIMLIYCYARKRLQ